MNEHTLLTIICNRGYSDLVMDIVRPLGAKGGTILHGKGSGAKGMEKFFNITLHEEKEIIIVVVEAELCEHIMLGIMKEAGLGTKAGAVVFTLPVEQFVILSKMHRAESEAVETETREE